MAPESVRELIKKIHALSQQGIGGEAETARIKLATLLDRYNLKIEDVVKEDTQVYRFPYQTSFETRLMVQCYFYVVKRSSGGVYEYRRRGRKTREVGFELTVSQYVDLQEMIKHYRAAWEKEIETLYMAFLAKHRLFAPTDPEIRQEPSFDEEEFLRVVNMMKGLSEKSFTKLPVMIEGQESCAN